MREVDDSSKGKAEAENGSSGRENERFGEELANDPAAWGSECGAHSELLGACGRAGELLGLEEAIHMLTEVPASSFGLVDRGVLREGAWADMVLFDPSEIDTTRMHPLTDWPGNAWHLTTEAVGIDRVFVAGREVVVDGEYTGQLPGRLLRSGRDTVTVAPR